jgi:hypothetical protein
MSIECAPHERTSPAQIMHHTHLAKRIVSHTHTHTHKEERQPTPSTNSRTQMATAMTAGGATAAACTTALQQAGRTCINGMHSSSATPRSSSSLSSNFLCTRVTILTEFLVVYLFVSDFQGVDCLEQQLLCCDWGTLQLVCGGSYR